MIDPIELSILKADIEGSDEHQFEKLKEWADALQVPIIDNSKDQKVLYDPKDAS